MLITVPVSIIRMLKLFICFLTECQQEAHSRLVEVPVVNRENRKHKPNIDLSKLLPLEGTDDLPFSPSIAEPEGCSDLLIFCVFTVYFLYSARIQLLYR